MSAILARVQSGPVWDVASIAPVDSGFPRLHIEWHGGNGFVIQCYEDEHSWSDFLLAGPSCGPPAVEINLGGQALERWPQELFVPEKLAHQAVHRSGSMPVLGRRSGKAIKVERPGNGRSTNRTATSNKGFAERSTSGLYSSARFSVHCGSLRSLIRSQSIPKYKPWCGRTALTLILLHFMTGQFTKRSCTNEPEAGKASQPDRSLIQPPNTTLPPTNRTPRWLKLERFARAACG